MAAQVFLAMTAMPPSGWNSEGIVGGLWFSLAFAQSRRMVQGH